tara:strand:+ start:1453 stop:1794 length:342 start_codon:yes stop_codon:yes gene_type:complete
MINSKHSKWLGSSFLILLFLYATAVGFSDRTSFIDEVNSEIEEEASEGFSESTTRSKYAVDYGDYSSLFLINPALSLHFASQHGALSADYLSQITGVNQSPLYILFCSLKLHA